MSSEFIEGQYAFSIKLGESFIFCCQRCLGNRSIIVFCPLPIDNFLTICLDCGQTQGLWPFKESI